MPIQPGTFMPLPPRSVILEQILEEHRHLHDLTSYLWYIMPVADRFGDRVYAVAAKALAANGVEATPEILKALAEELKNPEGMQRYAEVRRKHAEGHICG